MTNREKAAAILQARWIITLWDEQSYLGEEYTVSSFQEMLTENYGLHWSEQTITGLGVGRRSVCQTRHWELGSHLSYFRYQQAQRMTVRRSLRLSSPRLMRMMALGFKTDPEFNLPLPTNRNTGARTSVLAFPFCTTLNLNRRQPDETRRKTPSNQRLHTAHNPVQRIRLREA